MLGAVAAAALSALHMLPTTPHPSVMGAASTLSGHLSPGARVKTKMERVHRLPSMAGRVADPKKAGRGNRIQGCFEENMTRNLMLHSRAHLLMHVRMYVQRSMGGNPSAFIHQCRITDSAFRFGLLGGVERINSPAAVCFRCTEERKSI